MAMSTSLLAGLEPMYVYMYVYVFRVGPSASTLRLLAGYGLGLLWEADVVLGRDAESRGPRESIHKFGWLITTENPVMFFEYPIR